MQAARPDLSELTVCKPSRIRAALAAVAWSSRIWEGLGARSLPVSPPARSSKSGSMFAPAAFLVRGHLRFPLPWERRRKGILFEQLQLVQVLQSALLLLASVPVIATRGWSRGFHPGLSWLCQAVVWAGGGGARWLSLLSLLKSSQPWEP